MLFYLVDDIIGNLGGNGEADADVAAGAAVDGGIDPDHLTLEIEERAAGIAGIDGCVGLDEAVIGAVAQGSTLAADNPGGNGLFEAEGVADGHDPVAHP